MNAIKLSEKEEDYLLEMLIYFFPEYKGIAINKPDNDHLMITTNDPIFLLELNKQGLGNDPRFDKKDRVFHWFEFTLLHLVKKIVQMLDNNLADEGREASHQYEIRITGEMIKFLCFEQMFKEKPISPISYLYDIFKKNKPI